MSETARSVDERGTNGVRTRALTRRFGELLAVDSLDLTVAGYDVVREPAEVRRHIGYVPQLVSADGGLTGYENLLLSARLYDIPRAGRDARIGESLEFMGLGEVAVRVVRTYSGGMIRRLELAQAMLHHPAVLFLDEPTIRLDPHARHLVWDRLRESRRRFDLTVLLTTHDMEEGGSYRDTRSIRSTADRVG